MQTTALALRPQPRPRQIALLLGAGALVAVTALVGRALIDFRDYASDHLVEFSAAYKPISDLATLSRESDLVIVGKIADAGTLHFANQAGGAPSNNPAPRAPDATGKKADALKTGASVAVAPAPSGKVVNTINGTPFTTFDVQIERVVRGNAKEGSHIQLTQPGGHVTLDTIPGVDAAQLHRTVEFEHDTLLQAGEEHLMFLQRASDGTFFVLGGPQGRLSIDKTGKVHPIDVGSPALRGREGQLLESLVTEVESAK